MLSALDQEADKAVAEMIRLGASFEITRTGSDHPRWFYTSRAGVRADIRRYWQSVDSTRPGFGEAMIRAIMRTKYSGAP